MRLLPANGTSDRLADGPIYAEVPACAIPVILVADPGDISRPLHCTEPARLNSARTAHWPRRCGIRRSDIR